MSRFIPKARAEEDAVAKVSAKMERERVRAETARKHAYEWELARLKADESVIHLIEAVNTQAKRYVTLSKDKRGLQASVRKTAFITDIVFWWPTTAQNRKSHLLSDFTITQGRRILAALTHFNGGRKQLLKEAAEAVFAVKKAELAKKREIADSTQATEPAKRKSVKIIRGTPKAPVISHPDEDDNRDGGGMPAAKPAPFVNAYEESKAFVKEALKVISTPLPADSLPPAEGKTKDAPPKKWRHGSKASKEFVDMADAAFARLRDVIRPEDRADTDVIDDSHDQQDDDPSVPRDPYAEALYLATLAKRQGKARETKFDTSLILSPSEFSDMVDEIFARLKNHRRDHPAYRFVTFFYAASGLKYERSCEVGLQALPLEVVEVTKRYVALSHPDLDVAVLYERATRVVHISISGTMMRVEAGDPTWKTFASWEGPNPRNEWVLLLIDDGTGKRTSERTVPWIYTQLKKSVSFQLS
jgi:hypothetical protein